MPWAPMAFSRPPFPTSRLAPPRYRLGRAGEPQGRVRRAHDLRRRTSTAAAPNALIVLPPRSSDGIALEQAMMDRSISPRHAEACRGHAASVLWRCRPGLANRNLNFSGVYQLSPLSFRACRCGWPSSP
jgi:hypothetical protein